MAVMSNGKDSSSNAAYVDCTVYVTSDDAKAKWANYTAQFSDNVQVTDSLEALLKKEGNLSITQ